MTYTLTVPHFLRDCSVSRTYHNISAAKAWKLAHRAARRGVKRFGGKVDRGNWGVTGGDFPREYHRATITASWRA